MTFLSTVVTQMQNLTWRAGALTFAYLAMEKQCNVCIANSASNLVTRFCAEKRKKRFASPWHDNPWSVLQWIKYYENGFLRAIGMSEQYDCNLMQEYSVSLGYQLRKKGSKYSATKVLLRLGTIVASGAFSVQFATQEADPMTFVFLPLMVPGMLAFTYFALKDHQNDMKFCHEIVDIVDRYVSMRGSETLSETIKRRMEAQESSDSENM